MPQFVDRMVESFERMSQRERLMVAGLGLALAVLLLALLTYLILDGLQSREARNGELQRVLTRLDRNRTRLEASRSEDARLDIKLDRKPPALQPHLESLAKRFEVEVKDYKPSDPKALGKRKRVRERAVTVSLYDIELSKFMKFINAVEAGGYLIMSTEMQVVPRSSDHGRLDIKKLKISAYEHNEEDEKKTDKKSGKGRSRSKRPRSMSR